MASKDGVGQITHEALGRFFETSTEHGQEPPVLSEFYRRVKERELKEQTTVADTYRAETVANEMELEATNHYYGRCIKSLASAEDEIEDLEEDLAVQDRQIENLEKRIENQKERNFSLLQRNTKLKAELWNTTEALMSQAMKAAFERSMNRVFYGYPRYPS